MGLYIETRRLTLVATFLSVEKWYIFMEDNLKALLNRVNEVSLICRVSSLKLGNLA